MIEIDWPFIYQREDGAGGRRHAAYWPGGKSGVTIADGMDLGELSAGELAAYPAQLRGKIKPYVGVTGLDAHKLLVTLPALVLSDAECEALEAPKRASMIAALSIHYDKDSAGPRLADIPAAAQTVLMSVTWQYGTPWARTPHFWTICCRQDWNGAVDALRNFGDPYGPRRHIEADYLERGLT